MQASLKGQDLAFGRLKFDGFGLRVEHFGLRLWKLAALASWRMAKSLPI